MSAVYNVQGILIPLDSVQWSLVYIPINYLISLRPMKQLRIKDTNMMAAAGLELIYFSDTEYLIMKKSGTPWRKVGDEAVESTFNTLVQTVK